MLTYIVRRLLWMIVLLLVISFLTFLIFSKLPSADPVSLRAGRNATPELRASIKHTFGLDKPFLEQYRIYLAKLVPFDAHSGFKPPAVVDKFASIWLSRSGRCKLRPSGV